jgi:sec-independent protein translocase protein TatB
MFDVGWIEMALIALIALLVIGPKELPKAMRSLAKWTRKARSMAREFQSGIDDMVRDADLEDTRKAIEAAKSFDIGKTMGETIDPTGSLGDEAKELEHEMAREVAEDAGDGAGESDAPGGVTGGVTEDAAEGAEGAPEGAEGAPEGAGGATVIEHPVKIAPPHSLTPPPEPEAITPPEPEAIAPKPEPVAAAADGDGSKQRA